MLGRVDEACWLTGPRTLVGRCGCRIAPRQTGRAEGRIVDQRLKRSLPWVDNRSSTWGGMEPDTFNLLEDAIRSPPANHNMSH